MAADNPHVLRGNIRRLEQQSAASGGRGSVLLLSDILLLRGFLLLDGILLRGGFLLLGGIQRDHLGIWLSGCRGAIGDINA